MAMIRKGMFVVLVSTAESIRGHTLGNRANPVPDLTEMLPRSHFFSSRQESTSQMSRVDQDILAIECDLFHRWLCPKEYRDWSEKSAGKKRIAPKKRILQVIYLMLHSFFSKRDPKTIFTSSFFCAILCFNLSTLHEEEKVVRTESSPRNSNERSLYPDPTLIIDQSFCLK